MGEPTMEVVRPQEEEVDRGGKRVVFLAGPIVGAPPWQEGACCLLEAMVPGPLLVANPRRPNQRWRADARTGAGVNQVEWETQWLRRADLILFWLALPLEDAPVEELLKERGRMYAQKALFELGEWSAKAPDRLVVGIEPGFSGERYVRQRLAQDGRTLVVDSLNGACAGVVARLATLA